MKSYLATAIRPKNIGNNGCIVSIDKKHLEWLDRLLHAHSDQTAVRKMLRHFPAISAIEVTDGDEQVALIVITKKSNPGQFQVDHYTGDNVKADFSLLMICQKNGINFEDLSPNINVNNFRQVANFVIAIHMYEWLMKTDKSVKRDKIQPLEIFGQPLI